MSDALSASFRFGTVGSPLCTPKKPGGSVGALMYCRSLTLNALELGWVRAVRVTEKTCQEIKTTGSEQDVLISVHAPYFINLNADEVEWPRSRQRLMDAALYGYMAGATDIVFHPGSYFGRPPEEVLPIAIRRLEECVRELREAGNPVTLRPETMGKTAMLGSLGDTLEMSRAIEGVEPCIDFAHLHARAGDGSMNTFNEWRRTLEKYGDALGQDALSRLHIHLSGIEYNDKGERNHLVLAESDMDVPALFRALKEFSARGRILCESPAMEDDALILQAMWKDVAGEG